MNNNNNHILSIALAFLGTLPGLYLRFAGIHLEPAMMALISGIAILSAAFLVLWACDVAQKDVSQSLALAMVAFIAVLPEYAVDMYFTWMAGKHPESDYAHYAIANMTGANRLLIGIGWTVIVLITWFKSRGPVFLEKERATEFFFLAVATIYAFVVALKSSLTWFDGIIFISLFVWYIVIASKRPVGECEVEGPASLICMLPPRRRKLSTLVMFLYAAAVIVANAEPFSEGLVETGKMYGINEFLLVQWLAPIASEAPEFIVAIMFAARGQSSMALGALISSKVNQWTLLVGMIPGVYALSSWQLNHPIPMSNLQMHEILLTAAQSLLGVALLGLFRLTILDALILLVLFLGQFFLSPYFDGLHARGVTAVTGDVIHMVFSGLYVLLAVIFILTKPARLKGMIAGYKINVATITHSEVDDSVGTN
ncbi:MAG TPA: sodium:calcium antiporter [Firmicutes bacterium]|nr:sodium:calcium antiporter [Bacillota bacterium]